MVHNAESVGNLSDFATVARLVKDSTAEAHALQQWLESAKSDFESTAKRLKELDKIIKESQSEVMASFDHRYTTSYFLTMMADRSAKQSSESKFNGCDYPRSHLRAIGFCYRK